jgi:dienelactone hydrolase
LSVCPLVDRLLEEFLPVKTLDKDEIREDLMKKILLHLAALSLILAFMTITSAEPAPDIEGKEVDYAVGGMVMKGYLASDKNSTGRRPGILVLPEWWGISSYERRRARMLAGMGYTALAVDMYGGAKQAVNPEEAARYSSEVTKDPALEKARFTAAMDLLKRQPTVDPARIAAIGYCFGGGVVLNMAGQGLDLKGVASFHGNLGSVKPARPGAVRAKILVLQGANDKFVTPGQIEAFRRRMKDADAEFRIILYPGATHSFTNPKADEYGKKFHLPISYDARADRKSWEELRMFLRGIFRG